MENLTTKEFANRLRFHDWWYMMSDSMSVWSQGRKREKEILKIAEGNPELESLFGLACAYHRSNGTIEIEVAEAWAQQYLLVNDVWVETDELPISQPRNKYSAYPDSWVIDWQSIDRMLEEENKS